MSLLPFFEWIYATQLGETIRNSTWMFPVLEAFHLIALGFVAGSILLVDLRLIGVGLTRQPVAVLEANARPILIAGLAVMAASGIPLFMSEAIKCYYSFAFWVKMTCLVLALIFAFTIRNQAIRTNMASSKSLPPHLIGAASLALWFGVAWGGRWIGFS
jgi:uncharacterized membrane protein YhdT